jgi:hypothetical protein
MVREAHKPRSRRKESRKHELASSVPLSRDRSVIDDARFDRFDTR